MPRRDDMIEAIWYVDDGYVNCGRSHTLGIDMNWFCDDASEEEIESLLLDSLDDEFRMNVNPYFSDLKDTVAQVMEALRQRREEKGIK